MSHPFLKTSTLFPNPEVLFFLYSFFFAKMKKNQINLWRFSIFCFFKNKLEDFYTYSVIERASIQKVRPCSI